MPARRGPPAVGAAGSCGSTRGVRTTGERKRADERTGPAGRPCGSRRGEAAGEQHVGRGVGRAREPRRGRRGRGSQCSPWSRTSSCTASSSASADSHAGRRASPSQSSSAACLTVALVGNGTSVNERSSTISALPSARRSTWYPVAVATALSIRARWPRKYVRGPVVEVVEQRAPDPRSAAARAARNGRGSRPPASAGSAHVSSVSCSSVVDSSAIDWVAQQQREPAAIDREQRLALVLLAPGVTTRASPKCARGRPRRRASRARRRTQPARRARGSRRAIAGLDIGAGELDPAGELGDRGLARAALERGERQQQQHAAAIAERGPRVRRPLSAARRSRAGCAADGAGLPASVGRSRAPRCC